MKTTLIEAPATLPVTWEQVKRHLRLEELGPIETSEQMYVMQTLAAAAVRTATKILRLALIDTKYELQCYPQELRTRCGCCVLELPWTNLLSVELVTYGDQTLIAGTDYRIEQTSDGLYTTPGRIVFNAGIFGTCCGGGCACGCGDADFEALTEDLLRVRYRAGYGELPEDVPADVQSWLLLRIGALYENREEATDANIQTVPFIDSLLSDRQFEFS
jgi:hypothetical protein